MFSGMFSSLKPDITLTGLGDKFLGALVSAVSSARTDLDAMRREHPSWFSTMHGRTLAGIIHDRIWAPLTADLEDDDTIVIVDDGPTRQIHVGLHYLLRIKRHRYRNRISTYPTQTALDFWTQEQEPLPGFELVTLAAGYRWDHDLREIQQPVISYRDGKDNPIWLVELEEPQDGVSAITWTTVPTGPALPEVQVGDEDEGEEEGDDTGKTDDGS